MNSETIYNKILSQLLSSLDTKKTYNILDVTGLEKSLLFFTKHFPKSTVTFIEFPARYGKKNEPFEIFEKQSGKKYILKTIDVDTFKQKTSFDIYVTDLLLKDEICLGKRQKKRLHDLLSYTKKIKYFVAIDVLNDDPCYSFKEQWKDILRHATNLGFHKKIPAIKKVVYEDNHMGFLFCKE